MSSPMFDGQYRSRPLVSLRGASKQNKFWYQWMATSLQEDHSGNTRIEDQLLRCLSNTFMYKSQNLLTVERGGLLERAHREREAREVMRREKLAVLCIQAFYRGFRVRTSLYTQLRCKFDQLCLSRADVDDVLFLSRIFFFFYNKDKDQGRLVELCKKWIQCRAKLRPLIPSSTSWTHHLSHLLTESIHSLSSPHLNPSLLLRVIEVFLSPSYYSSPPALLLIRRLNAYLANHMFFQCLLNFIKVKVPPPESMSEAIPTPLADSLLCYLTRPLINNAVDVVYEKLANEVLTQSLCPHVSFMVLPRLLNMDLDLGTLIRAIQVGVVRGCVVLNTELLYSTLQLVHPRLEGAQLDNILLVEYLQLISLLLDRSHVTSVGMSHKEEGEEEDAIDSIQDGDEMGVLTSPEGMFRHCLATIAGGQIANTLHSRKPISLPVLEAICCLCYQLIRHHGTSGHRRLQLFQRLAFNPSLLLSKLWTHLCNMGIRRNFGEPVLCLQQLARGVPLPPPQGVLVVEQLSTFCVLFSLKLLTLHDAEFYREKEIPASSHMPFSLLQLSSMVSLLRDVFLSLHMEKHMPHGHFRMTPTTRSLTPEWLSLKSFLLDLLSSLYRRDCCRPFCPPGHWVAPSLCTPIPVTPQAFGLREDDELEDDVGAFLLPPHMLKHVELLRQAPFLFPFVERVKFFNSLVMLNRRQVQGQYQAFLQGRSFNITIRREHVYEDAFAELAKGIDLRNKVRVHYINAQGLSEPGVDGGGVFREFLNDILKTGFDPNRCYFATTPDGQLYPNAQSYLINADSDLHYRFLGNMLGKALYEEQLIDLPFAGFFLAKLAAGGRGFVGIHHLASFDPDLYRNLLSLKYSDGNIEDLTLNFTMTINHMGQSLVYELKQGGVEQVVTQDNYLEYIYLVAHYKLNVQLHRQFQGFRAGLEQVIPAHWLRLFSPSELQVLISGAPVPIDVADLKKHTNYRDDYSDTHDCISLFWDIVSNFNEQQKQLLLKFVTSCSRPPLLGFKELHPPFTISPMVGDSHLPSASTCSNLLLLPKFRDKETMLEKLLYAIQSGAGFELC